MMERQSKTKRVTRKKNDSTVSAGSVENSGQRSLHTVTVMSGSSRSGEHDSEKKRPITAEEADRRFDEGEDVFSLGFDPAKATRPGLKTVRFNIDVPAHFLEKIDREARIQGQTRQALVRSWLYRALRTEGTKL